MCKIEILKSNDVPKFQNNYNMNSKDLFSKIIPPHNYSTDGFNNIPLIENLNIGEKKMLENELINQLKLDLKQNKQTNTLIVETLTYLKSIKSLPTLYKILKVEKLDEIKLEVASSIFEINQSEKMIEIALECFNNISKSDNPYNKFAISASFMYLAKFKNQKTYYVINNYINHPDYLISFNAKQALEV